MNRLRPEISLWVAAAQNRGHHCASNETEELPLSLKGHSSSSSPRYTCSNKSWTVTFSCRVRINSTMYELSLYMYLMRPETGQSCIKMDY